MGIVKGYLDRYDYSNSIITGINYNNPTKGWSWNDGIITVTTNDRGYFRFPICDMRFASMIQVNYDLEIVSGDNINTSFDCSETSPSGYDVYTSGESFFGKLGQTVPVSCRFISPVDAKYSSIVIGYPSGFGGVFKISNLRIEVISNSVNNYTTYIIGNNSHTRLQDGSMICRGRKTFSNVNVNSPWGSTFNSGELQMDLFSSAFVQPPDTLMWLSSSSTSTLILASKGQSTNTRPQNVELNRSVEVTGIDVTINYEANGRWFIPSLLT